MPTTTKNGPATVEDKMSSDKERALTMALGQVEKAFGKGAIMRLGETSSEAVDAIPTGSISLDLALGVGGVPRGMMTELYGTES
jgi:recombination protein RecA